MLKMSALIIFVVLGCLNGLQASEEISLNRPIKSPWNTEQLSTGKFYLFIKQIISFLWMMKLYLNFFILKLLINRLLKLKITLTNQFIISVTNKSLALSVIFLLKRSIFLPVFNIFFLFFCIYKKDICNLICCLNLN